MRQRTITALIMAAVMIPILIFGENYQIFSLFCLLLSVFASFEFRKALQKKHVLPLWIDIVVIALTAGMGIALYQVINGLSIWILIFYLFSMLLVLNVILVFVTDFHTSDFGNALLTIFYTSIGFVAIAVLRDLGIYIVVYLLLVAMLTDTFAYLFGVKFGKHKLAPLISPKKSIEGSVAGLVLGGILATVFAYFLDVFSFHILYVLILSFGLSILSQIGDLVASKFKRDAEIKDYSNLFPGHGGVLDRFDSLLFASVYLLFVIMVVNLLS